MRMRKIGTIRIPRFGNYKSRKESSIYLVLPLKLLVRDQGGRRFKLRPQSRHLSRLPKFRPAVDSLFPTKKWSTALKKIAVLTDCHSERRCSLPRDMESKEVL
jgi:hypothetical protein